MLALRCVMLIAVLFAISCVPEEAAKGKWLPKAPLISSNGAPTPSQIEPPNQVCKEEEGFKLVDGKCLKDVTIKEPEPQPVATECDVSDLADCILQCDRGDAWSCGKAAARLENGDGVSEDKPRAARLYQKSCDGGCYLGCALLAYMYKLGQGVNRDYTRAIALFQRACDSGQDEVSCGALGEFYDYGVGVTKDYAKAAILYKRACDAGGYQACFWLGRLYSHGNGVPKDTKKAVALYKKGCDGKNENSCVALRKVERARGWRTLNQSDFKRYASSILDSGQVAPPPGRFVFDWTELTIALNNLPPAQQELALCFHYATKFFDQDVLIEDRSFKVSPAFLDAYKKSVPILLKMKAACVQDCLASDVRATRDACTARCAKSK